MLPHFADYVPLSDADQADGSGFPSLLLLMAGIALMCPLIPAGGAALVALAIKIWRKI